MKELLPFDLLKTWLEEEKNAGAQYAQHAILSTHGQDDCPHARVVSIREINEEQLLFFTQRITRKVEEIKANPHITLTFWLERFAREVIIEGTATFFSQEENEHYWQAYPQWAQIRFCSYAPTSGLPIKSKQCLEDKKLSIEQQYQNLSLPLSPDYYGVLIKPTRFVFYAYRLDELSDVAEYQLEEDGFMKRILSP